MAFVNIPRDLSAVKTRIALNLTKRQLICFGTAAAIGIPIYIFTRGAIGNTGAALFMIAAMFPLFFLGIYEKDGMPAEKILRNVIKTRFAWPGKRPYKTVFVNKKVQRLVMKTYSTLNTKVHDVILLRTMFEVMAPLW